MSIGDNDRGGEKTSGQQVYGKREIAGEMFYISPEKKLLYSIIRFLVASALEKEILDAAVTWHNAKKKNTTTGLSEYMKILK